MTCIKPTATLPQAAQTAIGRNPTRHEQVIRATTPTTMTLHEMELLHIRYDTNLAKTNSRRRAQDRLSPGCKTGCP